MNVLENIREEARSRQGCIVLPESSDIRVLRAAEYLNTNKLSRVILLGSKEGIKNRSERAGVKIDAEIEIIDHQTDKRKTDFAQLIYESRKHKGMNYAEAEQLSKDPLYFGACLVQSGYADGCVAGSVSTTADVLKAAIQIIGLKADSSVVSSTFLMTFEDGRAYTYADAAVVPYPDAEQLAGICIDSAATHKALTGNEPIAAMLSFSTKGSAKHERVNLVTQALKIVQSKKPDFIVDGELQFDAAIDPEVSDKKAADSPIKGNANVFIFPNLDAGNIAYKITQRLAGARATGPIIQGLDKPMLDLSRGCSWEDIVQTVCVCAVMS